MKKYNVEFIVQVMHYLENENGSYGSAAKKFGIPNRTIIVHWHKRYELYGVNGLSKNTRKIDGAFRIKVLKYMNENGLTLLETASHFMLSERTVRKWNNKYKNHGIMGLLKDDRGRAMKNNPKNTNNIKKFSTIEEEVQYLRTENEYLKKLKALIQEKESKKVKK